MHLLVEFADMAVIDGKMCRIIFDLDGAGVFYFGGKADGANAYDKSGRRKYE